MAVDEEKSAPLDIVALHRGALESTRRFVAGVKATQWSAPTPCEGWDARALLNHVVAGNLWAVELAGGKTIADVGDRLDGDVLGNDPLAAYEHSANRAGDAFAAPGALDAPCAVSYGPVTGSIYAGHRFLDVLIHGWDLATATGQEATLDPVLVEGCWVVIEPQAEMLKASGMFGGEVSVPPGASAQTRLLAALGRPA
jgi:uncharacterized protein (TIGR03086 family)